jgi:LPS export ABC transporter protein LptC
MLSRAKHLSKICLPALLIGMLLLSACENDIKKVQEISAADVSKPVQSYADVDIIYSDSAKVKGRMFSPLLMQYQGKAPYNEMPKGVKVIFYDKDLNQIGTLTSKYAIQQADSNKIVFRRNVVATNAKGETFKSEELIWDQTAKMMHSTKAVQVTMANGDVMNGTGFQSDQSLSHWTVNQSTGIFSVTDAPSQPTQ